jgi:hypothetical protein
MRHGRCSDMPTLVRRDFLKIGAVSFAGYGLLPMVTPRNVRAQGQAAPRGNVDFCIFLMLTGGISQLDTFDVKEGPWTPEDFDIRTITPDLRWPFGLLPTLARQLPRIAVVRSIETWESAHARAQYNLQTARQFSPPRLQEIPSVGSIVAYELESRRRSDDFLPPFVAMNFSTANAGLLGPGMLHSRFAPMAMGSRGPNEFIVPEAEREQLARRLRFLERLDGPPRGGNMATHPLPSSFTAYAAQARALMESPKLGGLLQLDGPEKTRYGDSGLGDACIIARNLVRADAGTRFVAISHDGWDMHGKIYDKSALYARCKELDTALGGLLDDLADKRDDTGRTLLDRTLIMCLGEFGRTPGQLTKNKGRDHHRFASSALFAGGGVRGGQVIGATDAEGGRVINSGWGAGRSIYPEDVVTTLYSALGIDWLKQLDNTPSGRTIDYIEKFSPQGDIEYLPIDPLFG